jgi:hypothetical protein
MAIPHDFQVAVKHSKKGMVPAGVYNSPLLGRTVQKLAFEQAIDENPGVPFRHLWCGGEGILA